MPAAGRAGPPPPPSPPGPRPRPPPPAPASVSTDRWWWASECTSSRHRRPAAARAASTAGSRPSLTLTTHSSTAPRSHSQTGPVEIGLALPQYDFFAPEPEPGPLPWAPVEATARRAEALGFHSLWLSDHLFLDPSRYDGPPGRCPGFDPLPALGALARVTQRIRLGTLTLCVPLRPATVAAKQLATIDVLSGGRLTVGLGAGWNADGVPPSRACPSAARANACATWRRRSSSSGGCSAAGPSPSTAATSRRWRPCACPGRCSSRRRPSGSVAAATASSTWSPGWPTGGTRRGSGPPTPTASASASSTRPATGPAATRPPSPSPSASTPWSERTRPTWPAVSSACRRPPPGGLGGKSLDEWRRGRLVGTVDEVRDQFDGWAALGVSTLVVSPRPMPFSVPGPDDLEILAAACRL